LVLFVPVYSIREHFEPFASKAVILVIARIQFLKFLKCTRPLAIKTDCDDNYDKRYKVFNRAEMPAVYDVFAIVADGKQEPASACT